MNASKIRDSRMWDKWRRSGAVASGVPASVPKLTLVESAPAPEPKLALVVELEPTSKETCSWCGGELGEKIFANRDGSKRFCSKAHRDASSRAARKARKNQATDQAG